ncbi:fibronectin type III domain-containing protein 9-like [Acipenser ruthenus]|uniref:fibronectin type III domain-containing protein 9-like n=1 Tax=Acipenser ruthenus TaxID=7906 RepID=UPI002741E17B|nr:fibronectin type III domain-containing protein 9-like [Acipenser ruthenus]
MQKMNLEMKNISFTSASVSWSPNPYTCPANLYRLIYRPNWSSILSGFSRQNFNREEMVPLGSSSLTLHRLTPSTNYIICVTCQGSQVSRDQCALFHTLAKDAVVLTSRTIDLATVVWFTSSILLIITAIVLLHGCFKLWCRKSKRKRYSSAETIRFQGRSGQAWPEGNAETALVDDHCEIPSLSILEKQTEVKSEGLGGTKGLLAYKKNKDKMSVLPQSIHE